MGWGVTFPNWNVQENGDIRIRRNIRVGTIWRIRPVQVLIWTLKYNRKKTIKTWKHNRNKNINTQSIETKKQKDSKTWITTTALLIKNSIESTVFTIWKYVDLTVHPKHKWLYMTNPEYLILLELGRQNRAKLRKYHLVKNHCACVVCVISNISHHVYWSGSKVS